MTMSTLKGYGYSIWLLPKNWRQLKKDLQLEFIPHVTVATNLPYLPYGILDETKIFTVKKFERGTVFPKMYRTDPMHGFGHYCEIEGPPPQLLTEHRPHFTLFYSPNPIEYLDTVSWHGLSPVSGELKCTLVIANTNSLNPRQWTLY